MVVLSATVGVKQNRFVHTSGNIIQHKSQAERMVIRITILHGYIYLYRHKFVSYFLRPVTLQKPQRLLV